MRAGTRLNFTVRFSKRLPLTLAVTYLRSYDGLCDVLLSTTSGPRPARVPGLWDKPFAVSEKYHLVPCLADDADVGDSLKIALQVVFFCFFFL